MTSYSTADTLPLQTEVNKDYYLFFTQIAHIESLIEVKIALRFLLWFVGREAWAVFLFVQV